MDENEVIDNEIEITPEMKKELTDNEGGAE